MTKVLNKLIPFNLIFADGLFLALNIKDTNGYDKDGNPTGEIVGKTITCVDLVNFEQIKVKVPKTNIEISNEELLEARENSKRIFIEFDNAFVKPYWNSTNKSVEDSFIADDFHIVESEL